LQTISEREKSTKEMKMKRILLFLLGGMPMLLSAQSLATKGYAAEEIVPQGVNFVKA
jgi:hypothetical protein